MEDYPEYYDEDIINNWIFRLIGICLWQRILIKIP